MKLFEIAGTSLQAGDLVKMTDEKSKYHKKLGRIEHITNASAKVLFKDEEKPVSVVLSGLERL